MARVRLRYGRVDFHPTGREFVMASISERKNREIEAANALAAAEQLGQPGGLLQAGRLRASDAGLARRSGNG
jgi:hypothetical protein